MKINNDFFSFCPPSLFLFMLGLDWLCCLSLSLYSHSQAGQQSAVQSAAVSTGAADLSLS